MRFWQGWEMFIRHSVSANESLRWGMPKPPTMLWRGLPAFITSSCYHRRPILGTGAVCFWRCSKVPQSGAPRRLTRNDPANPEKTRVGQPCRASSLPPLQKAQGWGSLRLKYRRVKGWASPPRQSHRCRRAACPTENRIGEVVKRERTRAISGIALKVPVCFGRAGPPFSDPDTLRLPHPCAFGKGGRCSSVTAFPPTRVYAGACPNVSDDVMAGATCIHHLELLSPPSDPGYGPAVQSVSGVARRFRNLERSGAHAKRSCQPGKNKSGTALPRILTPTLAKSARVGQPQIEIPPGKRVGQPPTYAARRR